MIDGSLVLRMRLLSSAKCLSFVIVLQVSLSVILLDCFALLILSLLLFFSSSFFVLLFFFPFLMLSCSCYFIFTFNGAHCVPLPVVFFIFSFDVLPSSIFSFVRHLFFRCSSCSSAASRLLLLFYSSYFSYYSSYYY